MGEYKVDGKALKKVLIDKDIKTIKKLSELSGINRNTCSQVLREEIYPSSDVMARLATALDLRPEVAGEIFFNYDLRDTKVLN